MELETIYADEQDAEECAIEYNPTTGKYIPTIEGSGWGFYDTLAEAAEAIYSDPPADEDTYNRFMDWMHDQDWMALIA